MKHWGKHLLASLDALGLQKVHVVGNSFGGSLLLATAARFPERFNRLCFMGTPCDKFVMIDGLKAGWHCRPSLEIMRSVMRLFPYNQDIITDQLVQERYQTSLIPGARDALRKLLSAPNAEGETMLSGMPAHICAKLEHPAIVVHGRDDRVIPVALGIKIAKNMPNADLHVLAKCGHWVMAESPADFVKLTLEHFTASR